MTTLAQMKANDEPKDFDTEISTPVIQNKRIPAIQEAMQHDAQSLIEQGYSVELMREDQVIAVTIPLSKLFSPNSVSLTANSSSLLHPFTNYLRHYGKYKLLLCVHSDDTGSESYRNWICEQRILTLYEYFDTHAPSPSMVYGYPMGHAQPIADDTSRTNRTLNRRLEIYIVPGPEMATQTKSKR